MRRYAHTCWKGVAAAQVADRFGYTTATLSSLVRDFRAGRRDFFVAPRPGSKRAPAKDAARARIIPLRRAGHSVYEIARVLTVEGTPPNRTSVAEVVAEEGFDRLWPRPLHQPGAFPPSGSAGRQADRLRRAARLRQDAGGGPAARGA
jgi:hypothetical protein